MSPVEDDPDMWAAVVKFLREIGEGLGFLKPYIGPALAGWSISVAWRKKLRRSLSAVIRSLVSSVLVGAGLTPLFIQVAGLSLETAGSVAVFLGCQGCFILEWLEERFGIKKPWDGTEKRKDGQGNGEG